MLLGVVDDRGLELLDQHVADDADREVGLLEDHLADLGLLGAGLDDLVQPVEVGHLALEVLRLRALRGGADDQPAAAGVDLVDQLADALALLVGEALGDADSAALRHVDEVTAGDRQLHREARALGLERVLDDLDDDLLAGLDQLGDAAATASAAPGRRLAVGRDDLVDVQEAVPLQPEVDEGRLHAGQHVVDAALVDVADDRALALSLDVELGDLPVASGLGLHGLAGLARCGSFCLEHGDAGLSAVDADEDCLLHDVGDPFRASGQVEPMSVRVVRWLSAGVGLAPRFVRAPRAASGRGCSVGARWP